MRERCSESRCIGIESVVSASSQAVGQPSFGPSTGREKGSLEK